MPGRYGESTIVGNPPYPRFCCIAANGPNRYPVLVSVVVGGVIVYYLVAIKGRYAVVAE